MNHVGTKTLETKRLILRRFKLEDANDVYNNYASNDNVTRYLSWPSHQSVDVSRHYIEYLVACYKNIDKYEWAIELKEIKKVIGSIGIVRINYEDESVEIGYVIGEDYWGKGLTPEALTKVIEFIKEEIKPKKIKGRHDVMNPNSGVVMRKVGMRYVGNSISENNNKRECILVNYELVL